MEMQIINFIGGAMLAVITYFLKKTMSDLTDVKQITSDNKTQIEILKVDYKNKIDHLSDKFDELKLTMSELIKEIKELNRRIK
jgi:peptidoglycan hydrolase CwlO-like protein